MLCYSLKILCQNFQPHKEGRYSGQATIVISLWSMIILSNYQGYCQLLLIINSAVVQIVHWLPICSLRHLFLQAHSKMECHNGCVLSVHLVIQNVRCEKIYCTCNADSFPYHVIPETLVLNDPKTLQHFISWSTNFQELNAFYKVASWLHSRCWLTPSKPLIAYITQGSVYLACPCPFSKVTWRDLALHSVF